MSRYSSSSSSSERAESLYNKHCYTTTNQPPGLQPNKMHITHNIFADIYIHIFPYGMCNCGTPGSTSLVRGPGLHALPRERCKLIARHAARHDTRHAHEPRVGGKSRGGCGARRCRAPRRDTPTKPRIALRTRPPPSATDSPPASPPPQTPDRARHTPHTPHTHRTRRHAPHTHTTVSAIPDKARATGAGTLAAA